MTASLTAAATKGDIAPLRQYERCIEQCTDLTAPDGYFAGLADGARLDGGAPLPESVATDLRRAAESAAQAYRDLATRLQPLRDKAPRSDACGRETYQLQSRSLLGATIELEETYAWGQEELARLIAAYYPSQFGAAESAPPSIGKAASSAQPRPCTCGPHPALRRASGSTSKGVPAPRQPSDITASVSATFAGSSAPASARHPRPPAGACAPHARPPRPER